MLAIGQALDDAVSRLTALAVLSVTFTSEPDGLEVADDIKPDDVGDIMKAMQGLQDTTNQWIDNVPHRGIYRPKENSL